MGSILAPSVSGLLLAPALDAFGGKTETVVLRSAPPCARYHPRQMIYGCVRGGADRLRERPPSKINTGHSHGPLFSQPSSTFLQTPSGAPACVWRAATAPLQGGRVDRGTPATQPFKSQRTPAHAGRLYDTPERFKTHSLEGIH